MRTSRIAVTACSALLGMGAFVTQAMPAQAEPTPMVLDQSGDSVEIDLDLTTPTTQPTPDIPEVDLVPPAPEPPFQPPLAIPGDQSVVVDPNPHIPDGECEQVPGGPDCEDQPCIPDSTIPVPPQEQCPPEDDCPPTPSASTAQIPPTEDDCLPCEDLDPGEPRGEACCIEEDGPTREHCPDDDPCRPEGGPGHAARDRDDCCPTGEDQGPQRHGGVPDECDETGTDGGTDGGGSDGRGDLPRTGATVLTYAAAGLGLTGIGALLKRLGRREQAKEV